MKDDGRVILSARIDPVLREHARSEACRAGIFAVGRTRYSKGGRG